MNGNGKELVRYEDKEGMSVAGTKYRDSVMALEITSRDKYLQMVALVKISKQYQQAVKEFFEKMRQKTYDAYQEVLGQIREYSQPFEEAERFGKQRMRQWETIEENRRRQAEQKAREKAREAEEQGKPAPVMVPVENVAHKAEGVSYVDHWVGRVVDFKALVKAWQEGKAPIGFLTFNEGEIGKFGQATKGKVAVPGIEWENQKTVRIAT